MSGRQLAVITGASSGIGRELALLAARDGHDLIIVADEQELLGMADALRKAGVQVEPLVTDLGTASGVDEVMDLIGERQVDYLMANAGRTLGHKFLDQDFEEAKNLVDLNISGTIALVHAVGRKMRKVGSGRVLITGSIAGYMPGPFMVVYNATKAFLNMFSIGLHNELKDSGVTITCLMPGLTDTEVFERGEMENTLVGKATPLKADPAKVARDGYSAMMDGDDYIVSGLFNKLQASLAGIVPDSLLAEIHRHMAKPR